MNTLQQSHFSFEKQQGLYNRKVRDVYSFEHFRIMVGISAFDLILLESISYKGLALSQLFPYCPAGTQSEVPKIQAMQLINLYEHTLQGPYGEVIGFFGLDGNITQAIIIRSFIRQDGVLYNQAGSGITINSFEENTLQEVNNNLAAMDKALSEAKKTVIL